MGWDDMIDFGTPPTDAAVTAYRGDSLTGIALRLSSGVVAAPSQWCNFDTYQADTAHHPTAFPGQLTLRQVYNFDPMPPGIPTVLRPLLWGGMCVLWTDYIQTYHQAEYMLLPRLCAFAECLWSPADSKDWDHFRHKTEQHKNRLQAEGYTPCRGSFKPVVTKTADGSALIVTVTTEVEGTYVYYTTDGSEPSPESALYTSPLHLQPGTLLRTLSLYHGQPQESVYDYRL